MKDAAVDNFIVVSLMKYLVAKYGEAGATLFMEHVIGRALSAAETHKLLGGSARHN